MDAFFKNASIPERFAALDNIFLMITSPGMVGGNAKVKDIDTETLLLMAENLLVDLQKEEDGDLNRRITKGVEQICAKLLSKNFTPLPRHTYNTNAREIKEDICEFCNDNFEDDYMISFDGHCTTIIAREDRDRVLLRLRYGDYIREGHLEPKIMAENIELIDEEIVDDIVIDEEQE